MRTVAAGNHPPNEKECCARSEKFVHERHPSFESPLWENGGVRIQLLRMAEVGQKSTESSQLRERQLAGSLPRPWEWPRARRQGPHRSHSAGDHAERLEGPPRGQVSRCDSNVSRDCRTPLSLGRAPAEQKSRTFEPFGGARVPHLGHIPAANPARTMRGLRLVPTRPDCYANGAQ